MDKNVLFLLFAAVSVISCGKTDEGVQEKMPEKQELVSLQDVALLLSSVDLGEDRCREVFDAVSASDANGYDEEYTMENLFSSPGNGVGDDKVKSSVSKSYDRPLRDLFIEHYSSAVKAPDSISAKEYLDYISSSAMQIYWPFSEKWDGKEAPTITFDPLTEQSENIGYIMTEEGVVNTVTVTEQYAVEHPVWVINNNDDASFVSLDLLRKTHPEWEQGGNIVIEKQNGKTSIKTLVLKDFTMHRQYDSWFRGASEFFCRLAKVESFKASDIEDVYRYNPSITDFMIVVKRKEVNVPKTLNTVLVSEWTEQFQNAAMMLTEDDGGTRTSWKCSAVVKYNSKSYGFEVELPYNSRDDVVWRGSLTRKYIEANTDVTSRFGDVSLTFSILDN